MYAMTVEETNARKRTEKAANQQNEHAANQNHQHYMMHNALARQAILTQDFSLLSLTLCMY